MGKRDNFTESVKRTMAERVAWRCCFPDCGKITIGPRMGDGETDKSLNLGEAAHIIAAAEGGPRYDASVTPEYRKSIDNGIWMCRAHARFIDSDYKEFSSATLHLWKRMAEERAYKALALQENHVFESNKTLFCIGFNIVAEGEWKAVHGNEWSFSVSEFIEGSINSLRKYSDQYDSIDRNEKFISVLSQGDARLFNNPLGIQFNSDGTYLVSVIVEPKVVASLPESFGTDLLLGGDGDLVLENGDFKLVSGVDAAIQSISLSAGTIYGEWFADRTMGSFFSKLYSQYKERPELLSSLFKLELTRLALIPRLSSEGKLVEPPLDFVKQVEKLTLESLELVGDRLQMNVQLRLGNDEQWQGSIPVYIKT